MEMCIGDQQYVTLLFYLDGICIFSMTIDQMLDRIDLVFKVAYGLQLKNKAKEIIFLPIKCDIFRSCSFNKGYKHLTLKKSLK